MRQLISFSRTEYKTLEALYRNSQEEITQMQQMLKKKDEAVIRYQDMLKEARDSYMNEIAESRQEIQRLNDLLHK